MANARALDKRRKSIKNIRKITRTMELIATARYKKAMDRALAAQSYTDRITKLVSDLSSSGLKVSHPLMEQRESTKNATMLTLTSNRGFCGGYNGHVIRMAQGHWGDLARESRQRSLEISGKRGIGAMKYSEVPIAHEFTHFEDKPRFHEVEVLADRYLSDFAAGRMDRLDIVYTKFESTARQYAVTETLLPFQSLEADDDSVPLAEHTMYEFQPSAESILEEVVPTSFKVKLFKCFLDAAVSEQVARMIAMRAATDNAGELIQQLSTQYNRARQSQITGEIMEIIGGVEALNS